MNEKLVDFQTFITSLKRPQWLRHMEWHPQVDSTNTLARRVSLDRPDHLPAVIVADLQTHGRGRSSHTWWSPSGCLMMTLAISADLLPEQRSHWNQLALIAGVALGEAVESVCPELKTQLKWPNDMYLNGRKAAGILIESFVPVSRPTVFLIGIGVNVDVDWQTAPDELTSKATCLATECRRSISLVQVLRSLIDSVAERLEEWRAGHSHWHQFWQERCFLQGRNIAVLTPAGLDDRGKSSSVGRCEGVAADGQLLLRTDRGSLLPFSVGEIQLLDSAP